MHIADSRQRTAQGLLSTTGPPLSVSSAGGRIYVQPQSVFAFHKLPEACRCETHSLLTTPSSYCWHLAASHSRLPFPLCPAGNVTRRCVRPLVLLCAVSPFLLHVRSPGLPPVWYACRRARMADESRPSVFASLWIFESVEIPKRLLTLFPGAWRRHGKWILRSRAVGPHRPLQISGALLSPYVCSTDTCTTA
jgi:hypothetical protein